MYAHIHGNLTRQHKGFLLLESLLHEELGLLAERKTDEVSALEFSIHELLRQLASERGEVKSVMQGTRVAEYASLLPEEEGETIRSLLKEIGQAEQRCARQATRNTQVVLALMDENQSLLDNFYNAVKPRNQVTYGAKGHLTDRPIGASLISGRL